MALTNKEYDHKRFGLYDVDNYADRGNTALSNAASSRAATRPDDFGKEKSSPGLIEKVATAGSLMESTGIGDAIKDGIPSLKDYFKKESTSKPSTTIGSFDPSADQKTMVAGGGGGGGESSGLKTAAGTGLEAGGMVAGTAIGGPVGGIIGKAAGSAIASIFDLG